MISFGHVNLYVNYHILLAKGEGFYKRRIISAKVYRFDKFTSICLI